VLCTMTGLGEASGAVGKGPAVTEVVRRGHQPDTVHSA